MKQELEPIDQKAIAKMDESLLLVTDSQEVRIILEHLGYDPDENSRYGGAFVETYQGDYAEVWVFAGNVPYIHKTALKLV